MTIDEFLGEAKTVAIFGHVRPDGDCVGSTTAIYNYICDNFPGIRADLFLEKFPKATRSCAGQAMRARPTLRNATAGNPTTLLS